MSLHIVRWHVLPRLVHAGQPQIIVDVWLPVALVMPMIFAVSSIRADARDGWAAFGGPILCAILAAALAMIARSGRSSAFGEGSLLHEEDATGTLWPLRVRLLGAAMLSGLVLLMLGAAHTLSIWIGQAAFAIIAVLLWINTPDDAPPAGDERDGVGAGLGIAMMSIVVLAIAQGASSLGVEAQQTELSSALMIAHAAAALGMTAFLVSPGIAVRIGLWAASVGVLGSLGVLSLMYVLPRAASAAMSLAEGYEPVPQQIAYGFGAFAFEATALLVLAPAMLVLLQIESVLRRAIGWLFVLGAMVLIAYRMGVLG